MGVIFPMNVSLQSLQIYEHFDITYQSSRPSNLSPTGGGGLLAQAIGNMDIEFRSHSWEKAHDIPSRDMHSHRVIENPSEYQTFVTEIHRHHANTSTSTRGTPDLKDSNNSDNNKGRVVVFICNGGYSEPVIMSIQSLRKDGGYHGDVVVVLDEDNPSSTTTAPVTRQSMRQQLLQQNIHQNVVIYTVQELMDTLMLDLHQAQPNNDQQQQQQDDVPYNYSALKEAPPASDCLPSHRKRGRAAYYHKLLLYHPTIALQWRYVLYMDACMTFHLPYIDKIFEVSERQHPHSVLAALDLWRWRDKGLASQLVSSRAEYEREQRKISKKNPSAPQEKEEEICMIGANAEKLLQHIVHSSPRSESLLSIPSSKCFCWR